MLIKPFPLIYRRRAGRKARGEAPAPPAPPAPPAALTLVAAVYEPGTFIRLTFDRAIDIGSLVPAAILVDDGEFAMSQYQGRMPAALIDPQTVEMELVDIGGSTTADPRLSAGAGTGIVADDDGGTWPGVSNLLLPFP